VQTPAQLAQWARHAADGSGFGAYYGHLLETQRPHRVAASIKQHPTSLNELLALLEDAQTPMSVRIGIGVVLEDLHDSPILLHGLSSLLRLATSDEANIRADAAHYLGFVDAPESRRQLEALMHDDHPDVREIAAESLQPSNGEE
jgi:hypothetical protein